MGRIFCMKRPPFAWADKSIPAAAGARKQLRYFTSAVILQFIRKGQDCFKVLAKEQIIVFGRYGLTFLSRLILGLTLK